MDHNRIIIQAARAVLRPAGLFQKGSSRIWVDDNGWFLTIVEYQPSSWGKGSYLNVGIHFLWRKQDFLSFDFGSRENAFISAENDEFQNKMILLSQKALNAVYKYRKFQNLTYAIDQMTRDAAGIETHRLYHMMMVRGLAGDPSAIDYYNALWNRVRFSTVVYEIEYRQELSEIIAPLISNTQKFKTYVQEKIIDQRKFWYTKSSMKKMNTSFDFN